MITHAMLIALLAVLASLPLGAQTTVTLGSFSSYVVENGDQPYDKPIVYTSVRRSLPLGFHIGLWGSTGTEGGRELDYLVGWESKNFSMDVGYYAHAGGSSSNLVQVDLRCTYPFKKGNHSLELYVAGSAILPTNSTGDSGTFLRAGLSDNWAFHENTEFVQNIWIMRDSGIFKEERGFTFRYEASVEFKHRSVVFSPVVQVSLPINMTDKKTHIAFGMKIKM